MEQITIPDLTYKSVVLSHIVYEALYAKIVEQLKKIPNITGFKLSNEFTSLVCLTVESSVYDNKIKEKIDKKKLVVSILTALFSLTVPEQVLIGSQIEFILENKLIKRVKKALYTKVYRKMLKHTVGKK